MWGISFIDNHGHTLLATCNMKNPKFLEDKVNWDIKQIELSQDDRLIGVKMGLRKNKFAGIFDL